MCHPTPLTAHRGVVLHDQGEGYQPAILEVGVAKYEGGNYMMFSKFRCKPHVPLRTNITNP